MGTTDVIFTSFCYGASMLSLYHLYLFLHPAKISSYAPEEQQHSVMASSAFKDRIKKSAVSGLSRAWYNLLTVVVLEVLMVYWKKSSYVVWTVGFEPHHLLLAYKFGWILLFVQSFAIDHLDLFGWKNSDAEKNLPVRHPLVLGFLFIFFSVAQVTLDRFILSVSLLLYLIVTGRSRNQNT